MPIRKDQRAYLELYQQKFICFDHESMRIYGDFHSQSARTIHVQFMRCSNSTESEQICKSDEEITNFMKGKYILLLTNQIRFDS